MEETNISVCIMIEVSGISNSINPENENEPLADTHADAIYQKYNPNILTNEQISNRIALEDRDMGKRMSSILPGEETDDIAEGIANMISHSKRTVYNNGILLSDGYAIDMRTLAIFINTVVKDELDRNYIKIVMKISNISPDTKLYKISPSNSIIYKISRLLLFFMKQTGDLCIGTIAIIVRAFRLNYAHINIKIRDKLYILCRDDIYLIRKHRQDNNASKLVNYITFFPSHEVMNLILNKRRVKSI